MNFALSYSRLVSDNFSVKKESKAVTTKKWAVEHKEKIARFTGMLYLNGNDKTKTIRAMLAIGYGDNIGKQIFDLLDEAAINKIATNMKAL